MKMMITTTTIFADSNLGARLGLAPFCPRGQSPFPLGLRVHTNSLLPKGSGLGGSSILALACARAIAGACALRLTSDEEMNTVLGVEQVLGTGGGWQGPCSKVVVLCVVSTWDWGRSAGSACVLYVILCVSVCVCLWSKSAPGHRVDCLFCFLFVLLFAPGRSNRRHTGAEAHRGHAGTRSKLRD